MALQFVAVPLQHLGSCPDRLIDTLLRCSLPPELALLLIVKQLA